jgi:dipeptidyl aminopeptidase/acylaminoacyl peptidase
MLFRRSVLAAFCFLPWPTELSAQTNPPVEAFGQLPFMSEPQLAPDGKHFAAIQSVDGRPTAFIYQVGAPAGSKPGVLGAKDWIVVGIDWVKNDRLVVLLKKSVTAVTDNRLRTWYRAVAVDPAAENLVVLMKDQWSVRFNSENAYIRDIDLDDPDNIFIGLYAENSLDDSDNPELLPSTPLQLDMFRVNVRTGDSRMAFEGLADTHAWYMDGHGHPVARIDRTIRPLVDHLKLFDSGSWKESGAYDASGDNGAALAGLAGDDKALIRFARDTAGMQILERHELSTPATGIVLFSNPTYDVTDAIEDDWTPHIIGASYADDRMEYVYFDGTREALQRGLEKAFPNLSVHAVSSDLAQDRLIVMVDGPQQPPAFYYLDRPTHQATLIASTYPGLTAANLGEMRAYAYKANDGLSIPAYLTLPPGRAAKNLPAVVLPHGGPDYRDMLRFDWIAQFFANRGYAVLQPNYRGSAGYGHGFTDAGLHQWGLKMQDDITDGVRKLVADGIADPKRICIVGGSYGGYAALAGAAFTPDLYACAVSFAGVSDLPRMLQSERVDYGKDSTTVSFWASRIGSDSDDSDLLRATSPARHADRVKCPVLLMHGEGDTTVRIVQSELMYDALKNAGKDVTFIRIPADDHYFSVADTRIRFLTETEKFLAAHIGTAQSSPK